MAQGPDGNSFSSVEGGGKNKHGTDKILTAGPSPWQSAQTNLVHELRCLVRARDMALAAQRARHVKDSILVREQQRTLATDDPVFIGKTAKLLRAADDVAGAPAINSPLSVSPVTSRPASPTLTAANGNAVDHSLEDSACCAQRGDGLLSERDIVADTSKPPDTDDLTDSNIGNGATLAFNGCGDGTGNDNNWESRKGFPPSPSFIAAKSNEESAVRTCSRCIRLQHELVTALTDRTLVEAELVSLRRASSRVDTGWEGESAGGAVGRKELGDLQTRGPGVTVRVVDEAENNVPRSPCEELGDNDQGLDPHVEIERLESLLSLAVQGAPLSDVNATTVDSEGLQMQESVLHSEEDEDSSSKPPGLAASLSATIARRARQFQELSRRRLLLLGAEVDLRAARAKLDMLLPTATMPSPAPGMAKGDIMGGLDSGTERQGDGVTPLQEDGSIHGDVIQEETESGAGQDGDTNQTWKKGGEFPPANAVPPKEGQGSSAIGRGRRGRGRSNGGQQSERGAVNNREKLSGRAHGAAGPSKQALGSRTADEGTTTTRTTPRTHIEDGRHPSPKDAGPKARLTKGSGKRTGGPTNDRKKTVVIEKEGQEKLRNSPPLPDTNRTHEHDNANNITANDNAKPSSVFLVGGQPREEREASRSSLTEDGNQAPGGEETTIREAESSLTGGNGCAKADPTVGIVANASELPPPTVVTEVKSDIGNGKRGAITPTKHGRAKGTTKQDRGKVARSLPVKLTKGAVVRKPPNRLTGEKAKTKSALTAESATPTRSLTATEEQQFSTKPATEDATGSSLPTSAPVNPGIAVEEMEDMQKQGGGAEQHSDSICWTQEESTCLDTTHKAAGDEEVEQYVRARGRIVNEEGVGMPATAASARRESISQEKRKLAGPADGGEAEDNLVTEDGDGTIEGDCGGGAIVVSEEADPDRTVGGADLRLRGVADLAEVLRIEVDKLKLEKAELEDTIAQLNVAAAQLYLVEYEQMKAKCRQLKRIVFGPASRPANEESAYGHSCQEVMHRLKVIGVKFFRRRIGGMMGDNFFPDGLARALTLIGRPRMTQGSQTAPVDRLGPLSRNGDSPALSRSRDVHVQVAGGIDVEDEPLMEQQVYGLLGKLDLLLKRREDVLWAYHREAEEGAREARALLASAAAQHHPGQAWGVSHPPNVRQLIGGREGPAGAPRPAINPTNLLFTAAVVLDSVAAAATVPTPEPTVASAPTPEKIPSASGGRENRRQRYSPAEKALLELADEVVAALDVEQRRSDASAERRRFVADRHNNSGDSRSQALGRPPLGVPPLIWAMEIHLVGKLARAFRTAVEARGFEREVEDANLVAAVTLGRSSPPSSKGRNNDSGPPWHLEHRMLSVLRGDEEEEKERRQRAQREFENAESRTMANNQREQQRFGWGADTYSPRRNYRPKTGNSGMDEGQPKYGSSPTTSPRRKEGLARGEQSKPDSTKGRTGVRDGRHASTFTRPGTMARGSTFESKARQQYSSCRTVDGNTRGLQNQEQREQQRQDSAAVARVEAAVFDTVKPSRLHSRPGSASFEGRSGRVGFSDGCSALAATERLRPQSARLPEAQDKFPGEGGRTTVGGHTGAFHAMPSDVHRSGRRAFEGNSISGPNGEERPVRTTMTTVALTADTTARRPASAGGRVVDTRTWSSNSNVVEAGTGVLRCRPNKTTRAAVRFEASATEGGVSSPQLVPTHPAAVPQFLLRKERELLEAHRQKQAAVNGRFEVVPDQVHDIDGCGDEGISSHTVGGSGGDIKSDRRDMSASEISDRWGREVGDTLEQGGDGGRGAYGGRVLLSSVRLEDSMDGEGLLPDAGEQAFFDAWKPTGYDIDLSRYD